MRSIGKSKGDRGSISVFSAIVMSGIIMLNAVLYDYAAYKAQEARNKAELTLACNSVLSSYDTLLVKHYALYGYNTGSGGSWTDAFKKYYNGTVSDVSFDGAFTDPDILKEQITDIMKFKTPINIAEMLLQVFGILSDDGKGSGEYVACGDAAEKLSEMQGIQRKLKSKVEGNFANDTVCVNGYARAEDRTLLSMILKGESDIYAHIDKLLAMNDQYYTYNAEAAALCRETEIIKKEITELVTGIPEDSMAYQEAVNIQKEAARSVSRDAESKINNNIIIFSNRLELLRKIKSENKFDIDEFKSAFIESDIESDIRIRDSYSGVSGNGNDERKSIQENLDKLSGVGVSSDSYMMPEIEYASMPSVRAGLRGSGDAYSFSVSLDEFKDFSKLLSLGEGMSFESVVQNIGDSIFIDDYIMTYMTNRLYGSSKDKINNEIEYILSGSRSAEKNNASVRSKILIIRFIVNFINTIRDAERNAAAESAARVIAAAVSMGIGSTLYKYIIIGGWALTDSYKDMNKLLGGESVPIVRFGESPDGEFNKMQDYAFYLRILLMLTPKNTKLMRVCDMIEINMKEMTGMAYRLSGVYNTVRVHAKNKIEFVFIPALYGKELYLEDSCEASY